MDIRVTVLRGAQIMYLHGLSPSGMIISLWFLSVRIKSTSRDHFCSNQYWLVTEVIFIWSLGKQSQSANQRSDSYETGQGIILNDCLHWVMEGQI